MGEVRLETADGVLTVTLADVDSRNALGAPVVNGLHDPRTGIIGSVDDDGCWRNVGSQQRPLTDGNAMARNHPQDASDAATNAARSKPGRDATSCQSLVPPGRS